MLVFSVLVGASLPSLMLINMYLWFKLGMAYGSQEKDLSGLFEMITHKDDELNKKDIQKITLLTSWDAGIQ